LGIYKPFYPEDTPRDVGKKQHRTNDDHQGPVEHRQEAVGPEKLKGADVGTKVQGKGDQKLVQDQKQKQVKLNSVIADHSACNQANKGVNNRQNQFKPDDVGHVLFNQESMLGNVPVVKIGDPDIEQDIENYGKIEQGKIQSVAFSTDNILNRPVYTQHPERFD